jgi:hypothetical protein
VQTNCPSAASSSGEGDELCGQNRAGAGRQHVGPFLNHNTNFEFGWKEKIHTVKIAEFFRVFEINKHFLITPDSYFIPCVFCWRFATSMFHGQC